MTAEGVEGGPEGSTSAKVPTPSPPAAHPRDGDLPETAPGDTPADDGSLPAAEVLERRVRLFEVRLYHGALITRAAFPVVALALLGFSAFFGEIRWPALIVWFALAVWTVGTLPYAWNRLERVRTVPLVVATELIVFLVIVYVGFDSRPWHLLHAFVPLALCACFARVWIARAMVLGVIASLWLAWITVWLWPEAPIDPPMSAISPSALAIVGYGLVRYTRLLIDDLDGVIAAQRRATEALRRARESFALAEARRDVQERLRRRILSLAEGLRAALPTSVAATPEGAPLGTLLSQIELTAAELAGGSEHPRDGGDELLDVLRRAITDTAGLGGEVHVSVAPRREALHLDGDSAAVRRILTEAVTNARKHGAGPVDVSIDPEQGQRIVVMNPAASPALGRPGHMGLAAIEADATAVGAEVGWAYADGRVVFSMRLDREGAPDPPAEDDGGSRLRRALDRRRLAYERGVLIARLAMAAIAMVMIPIKADQHRTLLPLLLVTAVALITWNALLLLRWRRVRDLVRRRPGLVWWDAGAMVAILTLEGGMSTPWIPVAMGSIVFVAYFRPWREGLALVALYSLGLLAGYGLMRTLPVDDEGTLVQEMPVGWLINLAAFLIVLAISAAIRWVFDRTEEAIGAFAATAALERRAASARAQVEARAEGRRELHATLLQFVAAARLRTEIVLETSPSAALSALAARLATLSAALGAVMADLARTAGDANPRDGRGGPQTAASLAMPDR